MGSNLYIADENQVPEELLQQLREERGYNLDHQRENPIDPLYLVGKRHATNPFLDQDENFQPELRGLAAAARAKTPHFTLTLRRELLDELPGEVRLYSTGLPLDIETVAVLRQRLADPKTRVAYSPNVEIA